MQLPLLERLKDKVKFDFQTLINHFDITEEYLEWWWENADFTKISRPETLEDHDPLLIPTIGKDFADLDAHNEFFYDYLAREVDSGRIPKQKMPRKVFRQILLDKVFNSSLESSGRPKVIFAGGGYGSGKTHILSKISKDGMFEVGLQHIFGVDTFKLFIPEFNLIQAVADGRASLTVQKECQGLGNELFNRLSSARRSFIWDSSMSNRDETIARLKLLKQEGYEMSMIAVLTPLNVAIRQAMERAQEIRRFPHPEMLPKSHVAFRQAFGDYLSYFDEISVFANFREGCNVPIEVARKSGLENPLDIVEPDLFNRAMVIPTV